MSISLNPTELPAIASQVGVFFVCLFFWKLVIAFKDLGSKNWKLCIRKQQTQPGCTCKVWGQSCSWYLACTLFTLLILKPVLRGCFGWTSQKGMDQGCSRDFTYFSVSGLEDRMDLFIHHRFPDVLTRTASVVLTSSVKCNMKHSCEIQVLNASLYHPKTRAAPPLVGRLGKWNTYTDMSDCAAWLTAHYELSTYTHANGGLLWFGAEPDFLAAPAELEHSENHVSDV